MRPEVSTGLFAEGITLFENNPTMVVDRGWLVLSRTYPLLTITIHHRATGKLRTFQFNFDSWNDEPPELGIIDPETKQAVAPHLWPQYQSYWHSSGWSSTPALTTPKGFLCMPGIREYHTHFSHVGDSWEKYRANEDFTMMGIVLQVAQVFQKSNV